ncbi:MAG: MFS transporter [Lachnospiraceae bacterium]|nr:MFS transporter [Lachnospiraceae bacterium]
MKLNYKKTILTGFAFMAITSFWTMYDAITPLILKYSFNLGDVLNGVVMAMDNVFALILLPAFGIWSDRTNTRFGKRMPFIAIGTIIAVIAMAFMPFSDNIRSLPMFLVSTGIVLLAMSFYRTPAVALMPDITPRPLRSKGNAVIMLMGTVGAIYAMIMTKLLVKDVEGTTPNYMPLFISIILFMTISTVVLVLFVPENKWTKEMLATEVPGDEEEEQNANAGKKLPKDKKRSLIFILLSVFFWYMSYNAINSAFSRYSTSILGFKNGEFASYMLVATVAAVISYLPIGIISSKFGRKKVIIAGVLGMSSAFLVCTFITQGNVLLKILFAIVGISWGAINVNSFPMVVDIASDGDEGRYTGYYYTFSMAAQVLTPVLSGVFLQFVSYRSLFPYGVVFALLAFFTMTQVKHGDIVTGKKKSLLEHFDIGD